MKENCQREINTANILIGFLNLTQQWENSHNGFIYSKAGADKLLLVLSADTHVHGTSDLSVVTGTCFFTH